MPAKKKAERLAKKFPDLYGPPNDLSRFVSWEREWLAKLVGPKGEKIYCRINHNYCYGDMIHSFQINRNRLTTVEDKHFPGKMVWCNESASLGGVRPFERGSITFEFLYKPLGLMVDPDTVPSTGAGTDPDTGTGGWDKLYTSFWFFKKTLEEAGGKSIDPYA